MKWEDYFKLRKTLSQEQVYSKAIKDENEDRSYFSQHREGWDLPDRPDLTIHPHPSLIPIYHKTLLPSFQINPPTVQDGNPNYRLFPLANRNSLTNQSSVVKTENEFKDNFLNIFAEGQLRFMNWNNVFAAGGSILACLEPIPEKHSLDITTKRKYYHDIQYPSSDIDLFLYGLTVEEAKEKLKEIYISIVQGNPHKVICFRSAFAVTFVSQYPFRHIQVVLRLYSSPYEVLAGFDVDCCTVGFDGNHVYSDIRAHHSLVTRRNTIDLTRRSTSYEIRLAKYSTRSSFEINIGEEGMKRELIDPEIFSRSFRELKGLAKLIALEKIRTPEARYQLLNELNRNTGENKKNRRENQSIAGGGTAETSNYSTVFLPWGIEHTADSCLKQMFLKDLKLNSSYFMKGRRTYRLHPCFWGTCEEILQDCSPNDPPFPIEDKDLENIEHREVYVRGPLTFLIDDPGRQRIGSFKPIDDENWFEAVYFTQNKLDIFQAINENRLDLLEKHLASSTTTVSTTNLLRDLFSRTPLQFSLVVGCSFEIFQKIFNDSQKFILEKDRKGRTILHYCAMYNRFDELNYIFSQLKSNPFDKKFLNCRSFEGILSNNNNYDENEENNRFTALEMSLILGHSKIVSFLLKNGVMMIDDTFPQQKNPFILCPDDSAREILPILLKHGYDPRRFYSYQQNIIHQAIKESRFTLIKTLFEFDSERTLQAANISRYGYELPIKLADKEKDREIFNFLYSNPNIERTRSSSFVEREKKWLADSGNLSSRNSLVKQDSALSRIVLEIYYFIQFYHPTIPKKSSLNEAVNVAISLHEKIVNLENYGMYFLFFLYTKFPTLFSSNSFKFDGNVLPRSTQKNVKATFVASSKGNSMEVKRICEQDPSVRLCSIFDKNNCSSLMYAIINGSLETCEEIIKIAISQITQRTIRKRPKTDRINNFKLTKRKSLRYSDDDDDDYSNEEEDDDEEMYNDEEEESEEEEEDDDNEKKEEEEDLLKETINNWELRCLIDKKGTIRIGDVHALSKLYDRIKSKTSYPTNFSWNDDAATIGISPIYLAILLKRKDIVKLFLDVDEKWNLRVFQFENLIIEGVGLKPIEFAIALDDLDMVELLLEYGGGFDLTSRQIFNSTTSIVDPNTQKQKYQGMTSSVLFPTRPSYDSKLDASSSFLTLSEMGPTPFRSLLHLSACFGSSNCFNALSYSISTDTTSPIYQAVAIYQKKHSSMFQAFQEQFQKQFPQVLETSLSKSSNPALALFQYYFIGGNVSIKSFEGRNAIDYLILCGNLNRFLENGGRITKYDLIPKQDHFYYDSIHYLDSTRKWTFGGSPLCHAIFTKQESSLIMKLIEIGSDPFISDPCFGYCSAFHVAVLMENFELLKTFLLKFENSFQYLKTCREGNNGRTSFLLACEKNLEQFLNCLDEKNRKELLTVENIIEKRDYFGRNALHISILSKQDKNVTLLLENLHSGPTNVEEFMNGKSPYDLTVEAILNDYFIGSKFSKALTSFSTSKKRRRLATFDEANTSRKKLIQTINEEEEEEEKKNMYINAWNLTHHNLGYQHRGQVEVYK